MSGAGEDTAPAQAPRPVRVAHLWCADFRCFTELDLELAPGVTVLVGGNGQGKTSVLEAIGYAARAESLRGVPDAALVRAGAAQAIVRVEVAEPGRSRMLEAEIRPVGRNRLLLNHQPVARARDLAGLLRVTVFAPDDLALVKGGPSERRTFLDQLLASLARRYEAARADFERVLRQRNALLRSGLRGPDDRETLAVFDEQFVRAGGELVRGRLRLVERLAPALGAAYRDLAGRAVEVGATYRAEWAEGALDAGALDAAEGLLRGALQGARAREVERGLTCVGPHRDDWHVALDGLDARTQASQGEQRSLALALRLAGHTVSADVTGAAPVLLLDDVFSELDPERADALVRHLPEGQAVITTASTVPDSVRPERRLRLAGGRVEAA